MMVRAASDRSRCAVAPRNRLVRFLLPAPVIPRCSLQKLGVGFLRVRCLHSSWSCAEQDVGTDEHADREPPGRGVIRLKEARCGLADLAADDGGKRGAIMAEHGYLQQGTQRQDGIAANDSIVRYFEARTRRLDIVKTTRTSSGQILDWVPIQSQPPEGKIASPPPDERAATVKAADPPAGVGSAHEASTFELEDKSAERGPAGTVPIVRKDFSRIHATTSLRAYLAKGRGKRLAAVARKPVPDPVADPDPFGYFHATATDIG